MKHPSWQQARDHNERVVESISFVGISLIEFLIIWGILIGF